MKAISLEITAQGGIRMLQDDAVDLSAFGPVEIARASHVEFDNERQDWFVQSAKTLEILARGFATRGAAIDWEKDHYAPGGAGWPELTGGE